MEKAGEKSACPNCKKKKKVHRDFLADNVSVAEGPKTVGSLADKHASKFSSDYKNKIRKSINNREEHPNRYKP